MMDSASEDRLAKVNPQLAEKVRSMAEILAGEGIDVHVVQGLRTWQEQQALWQQGRDANGVIVDASKVVTRAPPGHSWHQYSLAVDVAPFDAAIPDWNANHPAWKRIVAVGESVGLVSGSTFRTFPDWPHFQLTGKLPVSPDEAVRLTYVTRGINGVWADAGLTS